MRQWLQCASWKRRTRQDTRVGEGLTLDLLITPLKCNNGVCKSLITSSSIEIKSTSLEWLTTFYTEYLNKSWTLFMPQITYMYIDSQGTSHVSGWEQSYYIISARRRETTREHRPLGRCGTITSLAAIKVGAVVGRETVLRNVAVFTHTRTHTLTSTSVRTVTPNHDLNTCLTLSLIFP